ncbi:MAG TPA: cytochrome c oxidase assembly protein [Ktedonobacterales bacterium]
MGLHLLLTAWTFDPLAIVGLLLLVGVYWLAVGPLAQRLGQTVPRRRILNFASGCVLLALVVLSPLDTLARSYLFSAHAIQLFLLITVVAPLLMAGLPEWLMWRILPTQAMREATRGLLFPIVAILAFNGVIMAWHIVPLFEASLHNSALYDLQLVCTLLAGMMDWWPLLTPLDGHTRLSNPFQLLYLGVESIPLDLFGLVTLFSRGVFYPTYAHAPRVFGLSALTDQLIAGGIVAVPNNIVDFVLMSVVFFGWIASVERAQNERERAEAEAERAELEARTLAREAEGEQARQR